jgi:hypothetical protein
MGNEIVSQLRTAAAISIRIITRCLSYAANRKSIINLVSIRYRIEDKSADKQSAENETEKAVAC